MFLRKTIHDVEKTGNLYFLINAFIGAYNRRTDVIAAQSKESADLDKLKAEIDAADAELNKGKVE